MYTCMSTSSGDSVDSLVGDCKRLLSLYILLNIREHVSTSVKGQSGIAQIPCDCLSLVMLEGNWTVSQEGKSGVRLPEHIPFGTDWLTLDSINCV